MLGLSFWLDPFLPNGFKLHALHNLQLFALPSAFVADDTLKTQVYTALKVYFLPAPELIASNETAPDHGHSEKLSKLKIIVFTVAEKALNLHTPRI